MYPSKLVSSSIHEVFYLNFVIRSLWPYREGPTVRMSSLTLYVQFFIHKCLILKQVCKSHFINTFENTQSLRDNKVSEGEAHPLFYPHDISSYVHLHFVCQFRFGKHSWGVPPHVAIFTFGETLLLISLGLAKIHDKELNNLNILHHFR